MAFTGSENSKLYIWTGWLAFLIFVPLAITSTDGLRNMMSGNCSEGVIHRARPI